jgi:hypothetical protein
MLPTFIFFSSSIDFFVWGTSSADMHSKKRAKQTILRKAVILSAAVMKPGNEE